MDVRFSNGEEGLHIMLTVVFSFRIYEVCMFMKDSKDLLVSSFGDVKYRMEEYQYRFFGTGFKTV